MKYIVMCGGDYKEFGYPKAWQIIKGERLINRTIRLLHEAGVEQVYISSLDPRFDECDAIRLEHHNEFVLLKDGTTIGWWLDAYYPVSEPVCYLHGDVYFTLDCIKKIVSSESDKNLFFGTELARNPYHLPWGEPFGFKVFNVKQFFEGIEAVKRLYLEGKIKRHPISWELYRWMNGLDLNEQWVLDDTYIGFTDETIDYDHPVG